MAIIKCSECNKDISSSANVCPHCGHQQAHYVRKKRNALIVIVALILVCITTYSVCKIKESKRKSEEAYKEIMQDIKITPLINH